MRPYWQSMLTQFIPNQAAEKLVGTVILSMDSRERLSVMSETGAVG
jgi:hypothetical protein